MEKDGTDLPLPDFFRLSADLLHQFPEDIAVAEDAHQGCPFNNGQSSHAHHTHQPVAVVNGQP